MFDHSHYVPILRWKQAEKHALRDLFPWVKSKLTPLIEVPEYGPALTGTFTKYPLSIARVWGSAPFFFDFGHLSCRIPETDATTFFVEARNIGLSVIPTTGLAGSIDYQKVVTETAEEDKRGICVRLYRDNLGKPGLELSVATLLRTLRQKEEDIDLVIDLKTYQDSDSDLTAILSLVPKIAKWRSLTVASGAFPKDLTGLSVGQHELSRLEWVSWFTSSKNHGLPRTPTFGDYAMIHPCLPKPIPGVNISASIRYTAWDYWVVMRGEGLRNPGGSGHAQYPANAEL